MRITSQYIALAIALLGCGKTEKQTEEKAGAAPEQKSEEVVVYTSVDQVFSEPVLKAFEKTSGLTVKMVFDTEETKSTGLLNRLFAESRNPRADVFWSGDPVRPQVLARRKVTAPYRPPTARDIPPEFVASDGSWVGFSARARVLLVNNNLVPEGEEPTRVEDLADPKWKGRAVMANPAFGTTTMHMAALFALWGSEKMAGFLKALKDNEVRVASSNGEVKRLVASGEAAIGLTDTDDAAVAVRSGAPVRVVFPDKEGMGTLLMPTVAVLINGAPNSENAKRLIDYLASPEVERVLAFADCAQIPLRADVPRPPHVGSADAVRAMKIDYQWVGVVMEQVYPYLRSWAEGRSYVTMPKIQTTGQR
ncbi:MAG: extracellular solute-binding protein [Deltaproteobacteria bacterium]|nr:extracellular solute-binding protein [Deltaproteobacteria bacterium]